MKQTGSLRALRVVVVSEWVAAIAGSASPAVTRRGISATAQQESKRLISGDVAMSLVGTLAQTEANARPPRAERRQRPATTPRPVLSARQLSPAPGPAWDDREAQLLAPPATPAAPRTG